MPSGSVHHHSCASCGRVNLCDQICFGPPFAVVSDCDFCRLNNINMANPGLPIGNTDTSFFTISATVAGSTDQPVSNQGVSNQARRERHSPYSTLFADPSAPTRPRRRSGTAASIAHPPTCWRCGRESTPYEPCERTSLHSWTCRTCSQLLSNTNQWECPFCGYWQRRYRTHRLCENCGSIDEKITEKAVSAGKQVKTTK